MRDIGGIYSIYWDVCSRMLIREVVVISISSVSIIPSLMSTVASIIWAIQGSKVAVYLLLHLVGPN
jgi:hypothetical protein